MMPGVSVVIATYNYGRFLPRALQSVLKQTFTDFEIVVVDDGSTDETREIIAPFLADRRIRYYRTHHVGQGAAKNMALRFARGEWVAFLDADDIWLPSKLEKQLTVLKDNPSLGLVHARRLLIDEDDRLLRYEQPRIPRGRVLEQMFQTNFVCFSSAVARRELFHQIGFFDEDLPLAIDYDLWLRLARTHEFDFVDEPLVKYRTGHANLSRRVEERLTTVDFIMTRFLEQRGGQDLLSPPVVRKARAELYYQLGLMKRRRSRLSALPWYVRALALSPGYGSAWKGLASLPLPESVRRWLRRSLGKPVDWSAAPPVAESSTKSVPA